jgi:hypothetical protein
LAGSAALAGLGFTSGGVVAGSTAAVIQSGIGLVSSGSLFAGAQSLAATGALVSLPVVGVGAIIGASIFIVVSMI